MDAETKGLVERVGARSDAWGRHSFGSSEYLAYYGSRDAALDKQLAATITRLTAERDEARAALKSIAANTCCGQCQEAALVARAALTQEATDG